MKVYLNQITGMDDAMVSLLMSKRSWTRDKELFLRNLVRMATTLEGFPVGPESTDAFVKRFNQELSKVVKYGIIHGHATLVRFIDLSFTVEGLHRGAQDDFDSHAKRLDNRIVRASTRLGSFSQGEKSDWYRDKILSYDDVIKLLDVDVPARIEKQGVPYVRTVNGYIREDLAEQQDVKRGLYNLAIPSNFIFKVQYPELAHIVQHRDKDSFAHPELKEMIEQIVDLVSEQYPELGQHLRTMQMEPGRERK